MNPLEYLHLQLRLEGKEIVDGDSLCQVERIPDEEMPLMVIAQLSNKQLVAYYDETLPSELHRELAGQIQNLVFPTIDPLLTIIKGHTLSFEIGHYKTYTFPESFLEFTDPDVYYRFSDDPQVQASGFEGFPGQVYCMERDGKIVSACVSTLENEQCGEVWVYTAESYRRHGFAQKVVSVWAQAMLRTGKVPFYSHKMQNTASANLAKRLGLQPAFEEIGIAYLNV